MKYLFRFHRGGLQESLDTTIEVTNKNDIVTATKKELGVDDLKIYISKKQIIDTRLPNDWNNTEYLVIVNINGTIYPIGYSNFCLIQ